MSSKSKKSPPSYKSLDQRTHVLHRPDMYIGSIKNTPVEYYGAVKNEDSIIITRKTGIINPGLHRIFVEVISNCIDNVWRSSDKETPCTKIKVNIEENGLITVWNDGMTIPIEINEETGVYNPELIFGRLLTSSNYNDDEERMTSGRNGIGVKACNIFSKEFTIKTFDPETESQYVQTWTNNMSEKTKPRITSPKQKTGYTQISFIPDFEKFGLEKISSDMMELFLKNVIDTAMITGVSVFYNDQKVSVKNLKDYARLYDDVNSISLETKDTETVLAENSSGVWNAISFVNGIETFHGGVHVDAWSDALLRPVLEKINSTVKKGGSPLNMKDIKPYFRLFLNCKLVNPTFTGQEKSKLASPEVAKPEILQKHVNAIMKWPVIEKIKDILKSRELLTLKKTEKKKGFVKIDGLDSANLAGTKDSDECSLILCEGDSAKTFAVKGIQTGVYDKKGRDYFGIYPLKGKCLNVRNSNVSTIAKNKEICDVIQALNLRYGVDYNEDKNYETLSYGRIIILTDSDVDGYHICGLIINLFHKLFPTLLERNPAFVTAMRTPIVRIYYKNSDLSFYTLEDFKKYQSLNPDKKGDVKYFKGLGTNNNKEIETSFGKKMIEFIKDVNTDQNMDKVFHSKFSDERKRWLEQYDPSKDTEIISKNSLQLLNISDFLDKEMIKFSIDDCKRSIPNMVDGLKESHRKILYATFLKNLKYTGKTMKVAQLAGFVAEKTNYHHGEQCLFDTITKLAHDFVGSNNIPYLYRDGQFGTRLSGGKDAANARYIFTKLDILTRLLFRPEDDVLLTHIIDDGDKVEPVFFVPIIPTILVNGCTAGIGTGWSSQVPCYNPLDLVQCVRVWLENKCYKDVQKEDEIKAYVFPEITPWYRGFTGTIEKVDKNKFVTKGSFEKKKGKNSVAVVTELPISLWTEKFKDFVEELVECKDIKSYKNYSTDVVINFQLEQSKDGMECTTENLKLTSNISTNNMVLFTNKGVLKKYDDVDAIIEDFCHIRYSYYVKRKEYIIADIERQLKTVKNKMRFLKDVMSGSLKVQEVDEDVLVKELEKRGYDASDNLEESDADEPLGIRKFRYLLNMNIRSFTKQKLEILQKEIDKLSEQLDKIKKTTPAQMWSNDLTDFEKEYKKLYK